MTTPAEKLFVQCCMRDIPVPVQFPQMPQFQQLYASLAPDAQTQLYQLMDAHALAFSEYGAACFDQGIRFAFSLIRRLYPHYDAPEESILL